MCIRDRDTITLLASFTATATLPSKDSALTAEKDNAANNIKVNKNILLNFIISQKNIIISFNNVI